VRGMPKAHFTCADRGKSRCALQIIASRSTQWKSAIYFGAMATMVHEVLRETVKRYGDRPALRVKRGGAWRTTTWNDYQRQARRAGRALVGLGTRPGQGVAIIGYNSPEWVFADVGAIFAGGVPAGIYTTSSPEQVRYITDHCEASVAFGDT